MHFCDDELLGRIDQGVRDFASCPATPSTRRLDALRDCLSSLSDSQRETIRLHYEHGLHCKEIAVRLGIGSEAVKKHLQRGRAQLQRCLDTKLPAEESA